MTSSYYSTIGQGSFMPPDISGTNYEKTEADMVKSVNDEIGRVQDSYDDYYDGLINFYNEEFKKKTTVEQSIDAITSVTKFIKEDKKVIDGWLEFQKKYKKFYDLYLSEDAKDLSGAIRPDWFLLDPDVLKYKQVEHLMNATQKESYEEGLKLLALGGPDNLEAARTMFNGLDDLYKNQIDDDETSLSLLGTHTSHYRPRAEAGMRVWVPWLNKGRGKYVVYNEVMHDERTRRYVDRVIDSYFAYRHEDLFRGRLGKFKGEFVRKLIERADTRTKDAHEAQGRAIADNETKYRAKDLKQRLLKDPANLVKDINIYEGSFSVNWDDPSKRVGMEAARADIAATLDSAIRADPTIIPAVYAALNHPFEARDGHETTPLIYWDKEFGPLVKTMREQQNKEAEARTDEEEVEKNAWVDSKVEEWNSRKVPGTAEERYNLITQWGRKFGQTDPQKAPDRLKNLAYKGQELDEDIDYRLKMRVQRGEKIVVDDLGAISDPVMLDKWRKAIVDQAGAGLDYDQVTKAKGAINAEILERLQIKDLNKAAGNPVYEANKENAYDAYLAEWNRVKKAQPGISDRDAHKAAMDVVRTGVNTLVPGSQVDYIWDRRLGIGLNQDLKTDVQNARNQILDDNSLLISKTPLDGEEPYLIQAAKYINTTNAGLPGQLPTYYRMLARNMPGKYADPQLLMRSRLEANGLLEGNEVTIPEFENLPEEQALKLTVNPSTCKTYRTMQNIAASGEDINWMLDIVKDPTAMNEGGYDYVVSPNIDQGKDAHLSKPLTQHTVGEVLELARSGHSDFGAYGITADGLISIIEANQVPLDIPFDQNTQDLFVLGRLRYKAQRAQSLSTQQDAYRRLVNISPEDNEKFLEIVGDLPPFLQLNNMIAVCSTELVNQTLQ